MRILPPMTLIGAILATPVAAQDAPSLWDIFRPERLAQRFLQSGIMALRTQVDMTYGSMVVSPMTGQVTMADVAIWPLPEWDTEAECRVGIDQLVLRTGALDETGRIRIVARAAGVSATSQCWPRDARYMLAGLGMQDIDLPRVTLDLDYDIASAGADLHLYAGVAGMAAADVTASFSYLWMDARQDPDKPKPVAFLESAGVTLENLGGWDKAGAFLPPPLLNAEQGGAMLAGMLEQGMPLPETAQPDVIAARDALRDSLVAAWGAFLADPDRITIGTGFDPKEPVFLEFQAYEGDPTLALADLQPLVRLSTPPSVATPIAADLVARVRRGKGSDDEIRQVGLALISGQGLPRHVTLGQSLLQPLVETGDGEVALALSRGLAASDASAAYTLAMRAGAAGAVGAAAQMDAVEARLGLARVLELQVEQEEAPDVDALESRALIRAQADARMQGDGVLRSYRLAALWANLGAALGDAESLLILENLDEKARLMGAEAQSVWQSHADKMAEAAVEAWVDFDLPGKYAQR